MSPICLSEEDGERIVGAVEFDLEMRALGHSIIQKARASYLVTALSEEQLSNADEQQFFGYVFVDFDLLRSEEHTSELQSLMRISYAVFCLKKKKNNIQTYSRTHSNEHTQN